MKKLFTIWLIINVCFIPKYLQANMFDSIRDGFKKFGDTIKDTGEDAINKIKDIGNKAVHGLEIAGKKIVNCAQVVGYGTEHVSTRVTSHIMDGVQKSAEVVAFKSAEGTLEAVKKTTSGVLDITSKILSDITKNFDLKCARISGTLDDAQLEFKAIVLGKNIEFKEKFEFKDLNDLADHIYKKIAKEFALNVF